MDSAIAAYVKNSVTVLQEMDTSNDCAINRLKSAIKNAVFLFHSNHVQDNLINTKENDVFHQKLMIAFTKHTAPFYADIIQTGIQQHEFTTSYPLELAEMILTLANFYLDPALFQWNPESMHAKVSALENFMNTSLQTKEYISFFDFYYEEQ